MTRWTFTGQPLSEFPAWLTFQNFARSSDGQFLVVHQLWQTLTLYHGDTLILGKMPYLEVERKKVVAIPENSSYVEEVAQAVHLEPRETVMTL